MNDNFYPPQQMGPPPVQQMELPLGPIQELVDVINYQQPQRYQVHLEPEPDGWVPSPMDGYVTNQRKLKDFWSNIQQVDDDGN